MFSVYSLAFHTSSRSAAGESWGCFLMCREEVLSFESSDLMQRGGRGRKEAAQFAGMGANCSFKWWWLWEEELETDEEWS